MTKYRLFDEDLDIGYSIEGIAHMLSQTLPKDVPHSMQTMVDIANGTASRVSDISLKQKAIIDPDHIEFLRDKIGSWLGKDNIRSLSEEQHKNISFEVFYIELATRHIAHEGHRREIISHFLEQGLLVDSNKNPDGTLVAKPKGLITDLVKSAGLFNEVNLKYDLLLSGVSLDSMLPKKDGVGAGMIVRSKDGSLSMLKKTSDDKIAADILTSTILREVGCIAPIDKVRHLEIPLVEGGVVKRNYLESQFIPNFSQGFSGERLECTAKKKKEYYEQTPGAYENTVASMILGCADLHLQNQGYIEANGQRKAAIVDFEDSGYFEVYGQIAQTAGKNSGQILPVQDMLRVLDSPMYEFKSEIFVCNEFASALDSVIKSFEENRPQIQASIRARVEELGLLSERGLDSFQMRAGIEVKPLNTGSDFNPGEYFPDNYIEKIYTERLEQAKDMKAQIEVQLALKGELALDSSNITTKEILKPRRWIENQCEGYDAGNVTRKAELPNYSMFDVVFGKEAQTAGLIETKKAQSLKGELAQVIMAEGKIGLCPPEYKEEIMQLAVQQMIQDAPITLPAGVPIASHNIGRSNSNNRTR